MATAGQTGVNRKRIGLVDRQAIENSLEAAAFALLPDEYTQRDVFRVLMPKLYVMRKRGFGFRQITKLLGEAGLHLAIGTVRTYYYEFLVEMLEECDLYRQQTEGDLKESRPRQKDPARKELIARAQADVQTQVSSAAEARTASTLGRLLAVPVGEAAGASMAPAPAPAAVAPPQVPDKPAARGVQKPPLAPTGADKNPVSQKPALPASGGQSAPPAALVARPVGSGSVKCLTEPAPADIEEREGLPAQVYTDAMLEHPAIPGLLLSRAQRFFSARLKYQLADGSTKMETGTQMINRRGWTAPAAALKGRTSGDFVQMNTGILGKPPGSA